MLSYTEVKELCSRLFMLSEGDKEAIVAKYLDREPTIQRLINSLAAHNDVVSFYSDLKECAVFKDMKKQRSQSPVGSVSSQSRSRSKSPAPVPGSPVNFRNLKADYSSDPSHLRLEQLLKVVPLYKIPPNILYRKLCCNNLLP